MNAKKEIDDLINKLKNWSKHYYSKNESLVSDATYDNALNRLKQLEKQFPNYVREDSPTKLVGYKPTSEKFKKVKHSLPMLSLNNAFSKEDMLEFFEQIGKHIRKAEFVCEYKIDGVSISVIYENGKLVQALTRGDGLIGEDITHTAILIKNMPLKLDYKSRFTFRGEVYWKKDSFERRNQILISENKTPYKNPRNAVSGILRQIQITDIKNIDLTVAFFDIVEKENLGLKNQKELFSFFKKINFPHLENWKLLKQDDVMENINFMIDQKEKLDFQMDGVVIKVNDFYSREEIGKTSKFPKWAIAYKLPAAEAITTIKRIFLTVGRTGKVTYNAELKPVWLAGSTIKYATLHNYQWLKDKDIRENDTVFIHKAGEIIPEVIRADFSKRKKNSRQFKIVKKCPFCSSTLLSLPGEVDQFCLNKKCPEIKIKKLVHFVSRDALQIQSISEETIRKLWNKGWVHDIEDMFSLNIHFEEWIKEKGFKNKSVHSILAEIQRIKQSTNLERLFFGLGIRHVGKITIKKIIKRLKSFDNLLQASIKDYLSIADVGDKVAKAIYDFFHSSENLRLLNSLKLHLNFQQLEKDDSDILKGKKIVITGILSHPRAYFEDLISKNGGTASSTISKKTSFLLVGKNAGSKKTKAIKLKVQIINENEFMKMIRSVAKKS